MNGESLLARYHVPTEAIEARSFAIVERLGDAGIDYRQGTAAFAGSNRGRPRPADPRSPAG